MSASIAPVPPPSGDILAAVEALGERIAAARRQIGRAIYGQQEVVDQTLITLLSGGHVLLVGVPGLGKSRLVETLGVVMGLATKRVQFTPDLMPADILGSEVLDEDAGGRRNFRFVPGPVFCQLLMADEINRASPRTQSALLQAMQEQRVTVGGVEHHLPRPFHVLATQNPIEQHGTYPLPEAQLDRFMFSLRVDYPSEAEEEQIAENTTSDHAVELAKRMSGEEILLLQRLVRRLPVSHHVVKYATRLARATRPADPRAPAPVKQWIHCGAGPRATQYLLLAAKAGAIMRGSLAVNCHDVRLAALPVLGSASSLGRLAAGCSSLSAATSFGSRRPVTTFR